MAFIFKNKSSGVGVTSAVDTTDSNLIILFISGDTSTSVSDNKGNTWIPLTVGGTNNVRFYYCINPTVGSGHTFTYSIAYGSIFMSCFSCTNIISYDNENGNSVTGTSMTTGSVTPSVNDELIITGLLLGGNTNTPSIDSGFTITNSINGVFSFYYGGSMAYKIQTTKGTENPIWSWSVSSLNFTRIASFKYIHTTDGNFLQFF